MKLILLVISKKNDPFIKAVIFILIAVSSLKQHGAANLFLLKMMKRAIFLNNLK